MNDEKYYPFRKRMTAINNLTANEEDYMEMIYRLCIDKKYTRVSDIAFNLNVKKPSVSNMIRKLTNKNLLIHDDYGTIKLTEIGNELGFNLYERHLIVEQFINLLGIKSNQLDEVEKIEHTLSYETVNSIEDLVNFFNDNNDIRDRYFEYLNNKKKDHL